MHSAGKSAESFRDFNLVVRPYQPASNTDNCPKNRCRISENQLALLFSFVDPCRIALHM